MNRRRLLTSLPAAMLMQALPALSQAAPMVQPVAAPGRNVPPGFEALPSIGMGTWLTFDVGDNPAQQEQRRRVLERFFAADGGMIDSSPMYGSAEWLLGQLLPEVAHPGRLFSATKVWTALEAWGPSQLEQSLKLWGLPRFDVVLVHNLLGWRSHLKLLRNLRDPGYTTAGAHG